MSQEAAKGESPAQKIPRLVNRTIWHVWRNLMHDNMVFSDDFMLATFLYCAINTKDKVANANALELQAKIWSQSFYGDLQ